jgi:hypothetical protein
MRRSNKTIAKNPSEKLIEFNSNKFKSGKQTCDTSRLIAGCDRLTI